MRTARYALMTVSALLTLPLVAAADVFYLPRGATLVGRILSDEGSHYKIQTLDGPVTLPKSAVERVEPGPTPLDEYDRRLATVGDTADEQAALGAWCLENEIRTDGQKHLRRALELNPNHRGARQALGYVEVSGIWVEARTPARPEVRARDMAEAERLLRAVRGEWSRRIHLLRRHYLESKEDRRRAEGRAQILAIKDAAAIKPMVEALTRGDAGARAVLVEALAGIPEPEATANLATIALLEPVDEIRRAAVAALKVRDDPVLIPNFVQALRVRSEVIMKRAAYVLGELSATAAVVDLVDLLTDVQSKWTEVPVDDYFVWSTNNFRGGFNQNVGGIQISDYYSPIGVYFFADQTVNVWRFGSVMVYRSEVRDALVKITGKDFGFERDEWLEWMRTEGKVSP